jgi:hypothetical protein
MVATKSWTRSARLMAALLAQSFRSQHPWGVGLNFENLLQSKARFVISLCNHIDGLSCGPVGAKTLTKPKPQSSAMSA